MNCSEQTEKNTCGEKAVEYETLQIAKTRSVCPMCETYAEENASKQIAILSCEGACLRGEISRQAANLICFNLAAEKTVRICLGGAFTKDTGQRNLVRNAPRVIAIEGCFINCASRMMEGAIPELKPEVIIADRLYEFDKKLFSVNQMSTPEIVKHANTVAEKVIQLFEN
ncbi:MAG: putative zinc-binding protein [Ignavibacteriales bacterium]|nr:putative zinc-binding protein [Ignavibacteriales bacterium]